jgi:hypothetical protein
MKKPQQVAPKYVVQADIDAFRVYREYNLKTTLVCDTDTKSKAILIAELLKEREEYDRQEERGHDNNYVPWDS